MHTFCREEAVLRSEQGYPFVEMRVQVTSLAALCEAHVHSAIDFLTIDVEGHEEAVISGADWKRYRPRVIVIESTRPLTTCPSHQSWEAFLVKHAYLYATFDGLNRFYVAEEHREDVEILQVPPNVLDDFLPYDLILRQEALESRPSTFLSRSASGGRGAVKAERPPAIDPDRGLHLSSRS